MCAARARRCLFGQYRAPYLQTPFFASQAQFDSFQLEFALGGNPPTNASQIAFADTFQKDTLALARSLPTASQPHSGMYSSSCLLHCVTDGPDFWTVTVNGVSLQKALAEWYFDGQAPLQARTRARARHRRLRTCPPTCAALCAGH